MSKTNHRSDRSETTLLTRIFDWNTATQRKFVRFKNEQITPGKPFNTKALFKDLPSISYLKQPERHWDVFVRFWGLNQDAETLESIGESYGVTRERVRQMKEKMTRIMQHPSRQAAIRNNLEKLGFFF